MVTPSRALSLETVPPSKPLDEAPAGQTPGQGF